MSGQLCWSCAKCCNSNLCEWVKSLKSPVGLVRDKNNFIVKCPNYELDITSLNKTQFFNYCSKKFCMSNRSLYRYYNRLKNLFKCNDFVFRFYFIDYLEFIVNDRKNNGEY